MNADIEKSVVISQDGKKRRNVPFEEAINATGFGTYTIVLILVGGFVHFASDCGVQVMSVLVPAASCDLMLSNYEKGLLTSMAITGMLTSAHLCGVLADVYGRRKVLLVSLFLQATLCIVSSFAPDAITLMVCWFLYGNVAAGVSTPVLVYINEFCPESVRTKAMIVMIGFGALAESYLAGVAWFIMPLDVSVELLGGLVFNSWRLYLAVLSVPIIISMVLLLRLPESPKFVLNQGKSDDTLNILKIIYSVNNNDKKENFSISSIVLDIEDKQVQGDSENSRSFVNFLKSMLSQTALLFNRTFVGYTLLSSAVLLGMGSTYLCMVFWLPDLVTDVLRYTDVQNRTADICEIISTQASSKTDVLLESGCGVNSDLFLILLALGVAQAASFVFTSLIADRMDKKLLLSIILMVPGLLSIVVIYVKPSYLIIGILILLSVIPAGAYPIALSIAMRYFPTSIRSNAASVTMTIGRVGISGLNLLFGILLESHCSSAYWLISGMFIGTALLCIGMPSRRKIES